MFGENSTAIFISLILIHLPLYEVKRRSWPTVLHSLPAMFPSSLFLDAGILSGSSEWD